MTFYIKTNQNENVKIQTAAVVHFAHKMQKHLHTKFIYKYNVCKYSVDIVAG